ncbi:MAG: histidine phosphatase family protein [Flavobacteriaceae bacterium]
MKQLTLVRHGKSSWEYSVNDMDRPLQQRGINDAHLVAEYCHTKGYTPNHMFSSPANRALHTAIIFKRKLEIADTYFSVVSNLYDFSGGSVLDHIKGLDNSLEKVMIFGHNHAFTYLANSLGNRYIDNVPTAGLVQIEFDMDDWADIEVGTTVFTLFPKEIRK